SISLKVPAMPFAPKLAAHGAEIPAIGFGTSGLGDVRAEHIATALKAGYRHIDTAWKYGTERVVGEGMRASGVPRSEVFLCTKVSHEYLHAADFARSVDENLENWGAITSICFWCIGPRRTRRWPRRWARSLKQSARDWRVISASPISISPCSMKRSGC